MTQTKPTSQVREFEHEDGTRWTAFAADAVVAHGKPGAVLAFRSNIESEGEAQPLRSTITFNSIPAAEFALRTLGVKELRRRLSLAQLAAGEM